MFTTRQHPPSPARLAAPPGAKDTLHRSHSTRQTHPNAAWHQLATNVRVSQPHEPAEREADRAADAVVHGLPVAMQTGPAAGAAVHRMCAGCEDEQHKHEEEVPVHAKRQAGAAAGAVTGGAGHLAALEGHGQPLPDGLRGELEPSFGRDFSGVRLHTDAAAGKSARAFDALAYTYGRHVVFGPGQFDPASTRGRHLLAHELAHVAQGTPHGEVRRYRDVKKSERTIKNWGAIDDSTAGLVEKSAPGKGDPVIETIHVKFSGNAKDTLNPGELLVTGNLTAKYRAKDKKPDISIPVTGGSSAAVPFGLTDRITRGSTVQKIQGVGYNDTAVTGQPDAQPAPPKEFSHYVRQTGATKDAQFGFASSMGLAVYFKGAQAIHLGDKAYGSHACIHVDWTSQKNEMRLINYHSRAKFTKVTVEYDPNAAFKAVCCAPTRVARGFVDPCDVYSAADCASTPPKKP